MTTPSKPSTKDLDEREQKVREELAALDEREQKVREELAALDERDARLLRRIHLAMSFLVLLLIAIPAAFPHIPMGPMVFVVAAKVLVVLAVSSLGLFLHKYLTKKP